MSIITEQEQKARINDIKVQEQKELEKREEAKKNSNFVMMYREHMDYQNALMCSYQIFIDYFDISTDTVRRCLKLLKDNGFIDILKSGTSNIYIVNSEVVWCSWDNQKKYCQFQGKVLISAKENKDYYYRNQFDKLKSLKERENIKD